MDFVLDLLQGAGIAAAIGIRPFLPVLLVGALASADLGLDFEGTSFAFLEEWPFLLAVLVLVMLLELVARRRTDVDRGPIMYALLMLALVLGALQGAAVWLRPPEPGCEVEASLPTLSALGGGGGAPDLVRVVNTVATQCHRLRLRRPRP